MATVFLFTPPFTQLNTPYPATAYLKGFLNTKQISSFQADLGIELILHIFTAKGLTQVFELAQQNNSITSANAQRIAALQQHYINTIDSVIGFLQGRQPTLAYRVASRKYLPEAARFKQIDDLTWAFGSMGVTEKAKHIATLYLEDLSDFIKECIDEHFGFSRYAEKLGRCANSFDEIYEALQQPYTWIDSILTQKLEHYITTIQPKLVVISVPFPGNLFAALRSGQYVKKHHPHIKVAMGGGFANTELRSLKDTRVFEMLDFITLDDGEKPLEQLLNYINGTVDKTELKRTYLISDGKLIYQNNKACTDYKQHEVGTPDYTDLWLHQYIQAIEIVNPMHSLWSNGRWNKLTMAHGCYWGKCTFCDVSLDYIKIYEPVAAALIVDRMEQLIAQTGETGFHFVDEAAPPALMKAVALELLRRQLQVSWWTNIRFEKSFTRDTCLLLKASGCIGVSGGLEVASDRLLQLINKGITVEQVAKVNRNFMQAGIMVHAYLMYGFPTQTAQETIDSLEMVRQLFAAGVLQSGFWHRFTMTAHSPVGLAPEKFGVRKAKKTEIMFADNDVEHIDDAGANHDDFGYGLQKSLFNYMHGVGLEEALYKWFDDVKVPKTTVAKDYITQCLSTSLVQQSSNAKVIFAGTLPMLQSITKSKKGNQWQVVEMIFETSQETVSIQLTPEHANWLYNLLPQLMLHNPMPLTLQQVKQQYEVAGLEDFELFWDNKPMTNLYKVGLWVV